MQHVYNRIIGKYAAAVMASIGLILMTIKVVKGFCGEPQLSVSYPMWHNQ
jgi:hypothetical protein